MAQGSRSEFALGEKSFHEIFILYIIWHFYSYYNLIQALYEVMVPVFDVLGKKSFFLGEVGKGARMKLVVNMIMGR